jgi:hypothetical protein
VFRRNRFELGQPGAVQPYAAVGEGQPGIGGHLRAGVPRCSREQWALAHEARRHGHRMLRDEIAGRVGGARVHDDQLIRWPLLTPDRFEQRDDGGFFVAKGNDQRDPQGRATRR